MCCTEISPGGKVPNKIVQFKNIIISKQFIKKLDV